VLVGEGRFGVSPIPLQGKVGMIEGFEGSGGFQGRKDQSLHNKRGEEKKGGVRGRRR